MNCLPWLSSINQSGSMVISDIERKAVVSVGVKDLESA